MSYRTPGAVTAGGSWQHPPLQRLPVGRMSRASRPASVAATASACSGRKSMPGPQCACITRRSAAASVGSGGGAVGGGGSVAAAGGNGAERTASPRAMTSAQQIYETCRRALAGVRGGEWKRESRA